MAQTKTSVVVLGAGIAGMSTADALAKLGIDSIIVEKGAALGGNAALWACMATDECARCSACAVQDRARDVTTSQKNRVITGAKVEAVDRKGREFVLRIGPTGDQSKVSDWMCVEPMTITARAVVVATGFTPYDVKDNPLLSHGRLDEVHTTRELDEMLRQDDITPLLPADLEAPRVTFLQCVGSRDRARGRNHCSQFCCKTTIRQTRKLLHLRPDAKITVRYIDLQVMGKEFRHFHEEMAGRVEFIQGVPDQVDHGWDDDAERIVLRCKDPETGEAVEAIADRVVLSVGITASESTRELAESMGLTLNDSGFIHAKPDEMGRTSQEGVWAVGAACGPTDIVGSRLQALASAASISGALGLPAQPTITSATE